jgi:hypothetical protein
MYMKHNKEHSYSALRFWRWKQKGGQSVRPSTAVTDVNTDNAEWREIIIKGTVWQFKRVTGKGSQYCYSGMGIRWVCERWSPHDFSDKQKWKHVKFENEMFLLMNKTLTFHP